VFLKSVILIVHELVFNMCDSNMHGERIKMFQTNLRMLMGAVQHITKYLVRLWEDGDFDLKHM
jgi:hypothetical protein